MFLRRITTIAAVVVATAALGGCRVAHTMPEADAAAPGERVVALTFDDGPGANTNAVLDVLARRGVKATFFVVGSEAERHPEIMARIAAEGHRIGNHTWSHPDLTRLSDAQIHSEIGRTDDVIARTSGRRSTCVRPPFGANNARVNNVIRSHGLQYTMLWSIDTNDWRGASASRISSHVASHAQPGSVILMHDGGGNRANTVASLDATISALQGAGYQIRPIC